MRKLYIGDIDETIKYNNIIKYRDLKDLNSLKLKFKLGKFLAVTNNFYKNNRFILDDLCNCFRYKKINNLKLREKYVDLSNYEKIIIIGDIHGCYDVLKKAFDRLVDLKTFIIFTGDYINRGSQNVEVIEFLYSMKNKNNVIFIEGNHDRYLWEYVNNKKFNNEKFKATKRQIENNKFNINKIKELCLEFKEMFLFTYNGNKYFVSHGGLPYYPCNELMINSEKYTVGLANDYIKVDEIFHERYKDTNLYQIHGHSNLYNIKPDIYSHSINLEGGIELGGYLACYEINREFNKVYKFKNKSTIMINLFNNM